MRYSQRVEHSLHSGNTVKRKPPMIPRVKDLVTKMLLLGEAMDHY